MSRCKTPYWNDDIIARMIDKGMDGAEIHGYCNIFLYPTFHKKSASEIADNFKFEAMVHIILDYTVPK